MTHGIYNMGQIELEAARELASEAKATATLARIEAELDRRFPPACYVCYAPAMCICSLGNWRENSFERQQISC